MKNLCDYGIGIPQILLPKNCDLSTWSVIACDQYTQDKNYWKSVEEKVADKPSTLNLILPEVYLNEHKEERIGKIRQSMKNYLENGVFESEKNCLVYLERTTAFGRTRKGLVVQIDLDTYEWKPFSKANIRATEATIVDRIPPRMEIRRGAPLELPHIMLLVNDKKGLLVEGAGNLVKNNAPLYQGSLMNNGGSIKGWAIESEADIQAVTNAVNEIAKECTDSDGSTFLFAVGDGNHSLATAKAVWDEYKAQLLKDGVSEDEIKNCPVKYALVEIVNLYDSGLTFEPIHRVIFNINSMQLVEFLAKNLDGQIVEVANKEELENLVKNSWADFGFIFVQDDKEKFVLLKTQIKELAVARLQPQIDDFLKTAPDSHVCKDGVCSLVKPEIDYIHGTEEVISLGLKENSTGILLPPIAKDSFFETINGRGPLPRKSFSMGEADEKRFYLECRKLFE